MNQLLIFEGFSTNWAFGGPKMESFRFLLPLLWMFEMSLLICSLSAKARGRNSEARKNTRVTCSHVLLFK